ncbi:MAG: secondary thiamine-phosphate synthase enzyme YjbQ [Chloroflexi bacterium]|nr:secondary thiamine-phosphate synthase enzyme YjbQ [Chloroflexota bacterium]MCL5075944.1 secondary thiamine-phosphate synthase enzyme YjbQ [Chloroflexota bacterium]
MTTRLIVVTREKVAVEDITARVQEVVKSSGVQDGVCYVFVPHTTAGITINDNSDPNVAYDLLSQLDEVVPLRGIYHHPEGNAAAHIKASLLGFSETLFISAGRLLLGTWQALFLCEFDGPRQRSVYVKIVPA